MAPDITPSLIASYLRSDIPRKLAFKSLLDAREELSKLYLSSFELADSTEVQHETHMRDLQQWAEKLHALITSKEKESPLTIAEKRAIALLELHRQNNATSTLSFLPKNHHKGRNVMMWDDFTDQFEKMLEYAAIASRLDDDDSSGEPIPQFHMEFGIAIAIGSIAGKCRDPLIRRKALLFMLNEPSQEGLCSTLLTARVIRRVIEVEEEGRIVNTCQDIPMEARIQNLQVIIGPDGKRAIIKCTFPDRSVEETFTWRRF